MCLAAQRRTFIPNIFFVVIRVLQNGGPSTACVAKNTRNGMAGNIKHIPMDGNRSEKKRSNELKINASDVAILEGWRSIIKNLLIVALMQKKLTNYLMSLLYAPNAML